MTIVLHLRLGHCILLIFGLKYTHNIGYQTKNWGLPLLRLVIFGYSPADAGQDIRRHYPYHIYYGEETNGSRSQKGIIGGWNYNE